MVRNFISATLGVGLAAGSAGCSDDGPKGPAKAGSTASLAVDGKPSSDSVEVTIRSVRMLEEAATERIPAASIAAYKNITQQLLGDRAVPEALLHNGKLQHAWDGPVHIQVFPKNAWTPDTPATLGIVMEAVPGPACTRLIEGLSAHANSRLFRINVEPSMMVHMRFPVTGASGCIAGTNHIGYTVFAK